MKVIVTQGVRVCHDGTVYRFGEAADVPESVAQRWIRNGWASDYGPSSRRDPRGLVENAPYQFVGGESETPDTSDTEPDESDSAKTEVARATAAKRARVTAVRQSRRDPRKRSEKRDADQ